MINMNGLELYLLGRRLMKLGEEALPPSGLDNMAASVRSVLTDVFSHPGSSVSEIVERTGFPQAKRLVAIGRIPELKLYDIVLVNTRASSCIGSDEYLTAGCGMGREATLYLTSRGVRVTGIDAWGWDAPFVPASAGWKRTTRRSSGRATKPVARFPIAIWRNCAISNSFPRMVSRLRVFRTR